jgi:hypothetical protein
MVVIAHTHIAYLVQWTVSRLGPFWPRARMTRGREYVNMGYGIRYLYT